MDRSCSQKGRRQCAFKMMTGKPTGKRFSGRPQHRWQDKVRMDLKENFINSWQDCNQLTLLIGEKIHACVRGFKVALLRRSLIKSISSSQKKVGYVSNWPRECEHASLWTPLGTLTREHMREEVIGWHLCLSGDRYVHTATSPLYACYCQICLSRYIQSVPFTSPLHC